MIIPVVPTFTGGDSSVVKLQQLSQCVSFLTVAGSFPIWHYFRNTTQSIPATTFTSVSFPLVAIDTDGVSSGGSFITIRTQGYYVSEACIPIQTQAAVFSVQAVFLFTAGPSNPHYASGTTIQYGHRSGSATAGTGNDEVLCIDDICPVVCYPGDTIAVQVIADVAVVVDTDTCAGAVQARFVPNFTGRWIRSGT